MPFTPATQILSKPKGFTSAAEVILDKQKRAQQGETGLKGFSTGFAKGELSTVKGLGSLGAKVGQTILKPFGVDVPNVYSEEYMAQNPEAGTSKLLNEQNLKGKGTAEKIGKTAETVAEFFVPAGKVATSEKVTTALAKRGAEKELSKIENLITPKLTKKETQLAMKEGRIVKGRDQSLLRGSTPPSVLPSEKVIQSTQTIQREIPKAAKMKEPELYTALEGRTVDMAQKLKPEMQKLPIKPETVAKITSDWEQIKKAQLNDPYIPRDVNVKKLQSDFETRLRKSKAGSMDDLWETRKAYDASVPVNVKQATSVSTDALQAQKEIWLQNRRVLNDAMNDLENGMGETSRKAFLDMHDMYNAKENLLSKAKVIKEGQPSKVRQWIKNNPWKAAGLGYVAAKVTGLENKIRDVVPGI